MVTFLCLICYMPDKYLLYLGGEKKKLRVEREGVQETAMGCTTKQAETRQHKNTQR